MEEWVRKGRPIPDIVTRRSRCWRVAILALSLTLTAGMPFGEAQAVVQVVTDPLSMFQNQLNFLATLGHYGEVIKQYALDVAHYKAVIEHYAQQVVKLQGLADITLSTTRLETALAEITPGQRSEKIARTCPRPGGMLSASKLVDMFVPKITKPIGDRQQELCEQIAGLKVDRFNKAIQMVNRLKDYQDNAEALAKTLKELGSRQGDLEGFKGVVAGNQAMLEVEMQTWRAHMQAHDQIVSFLEEEQRTLGRVAMRGDRSLVGKLVQGATLAAALRAL